MPFCPQCGVDNPPTARFCDQCGATLIPVPAQQAAPAAAPVAPVAPPQPVVAAQPAGVSAGPSTCPQCGMAVIPGEAFCDSCGAPLMPPAAPAAPALRDPSGVPQQPSYPPPQPVAPLQPVSPPQPAYTPPQPAYAPPAAPAGRSSPTPPPPLPSGRTILAPSQLIVKATGAALPLPTQPQAVIGRGDAVSNFFPDIDLTGHGALDGGVGRRHLRVFVHGGQLMAEDLDSVNGSALNGQKLAPRQPRPLNSGDVLTLGRVELEVRL